MNAEFLNDAIKQLVEIDSELSLDQKLGEVRIQLQHLVNQPNDSSLQVNLSSAIANLESALERIYENA